MRILEVYSSFLPNKGGVERQIYDLCQVALEKGHKPSVLVWEPQAPRKEMIDDITVYRLKFPRIFSKLLFPFPIYILINLIKTLKQNQIDVIHAHSYIPGILGSLAGKILRKPVIVTFHLQLWRSKLFSSKTSFPKDILEFTIRKLLINNVNKAICISKYSCNQVQELGFPETKLTVIYNWLSPAFNTEKSSDESHDYEGDPFILAVGRLDDKHKGFSMLIKALKILRDQEIKIDLVIVGDGADRNLYLNMIKDLDLKNHVRLLSNIYDKELRYLFSESQIFCLPSHFEALALVVLEAMNFEKPVVATRVGGIPEIICDGSNGILVEPNPESIADGILRVVSNPDLSERISKSGKETVLSKFSIKNAYTTIDLLERITR